MVLAKLRHFPRKLHLHDVNAQEVAHGFCNDLQLGWHNALGNVGPRHDPSKQVLSALDSEQKAMSGFGYVDISLSGVTGIRFL